MVGKCYVDYLLQKGDFISAARYMCCTRTIRTLYVEIEEGREGVADRQTHNASGIHTDLCHSNAVVSERLQCVAV